MKLVQCGRRPSVAAAISARRGECFVHLLRLVDSVRLCGYEQNEGNIRYLIYLLLSTLLHTLFCHYI